MARASPGEGVRRGVAGKSPLEKLHGTSGCDRFACAGFAVKQVRAECAGGMAPRTALMGFKGQ
jgi:hypothetical protein